MLNLKHNTTLCAYFNFHSAEDTIFYLPSLPSTINNYVHKASSNTTNDSTYTFSYTISHFKHIHINTTNNYAPAYSHTINNYAHTCFQIDKISNIQALTEYNKKIALLYAENTSHKLHNTPSTTFCFNDMLRLEIPGDLLIELSPNEGNPLSAYDSTVYNKTIYQNLLAVKNTIERIPELYRLL